MTRADLFLSTAISPELAECIRDASEEGKASTSLSLVATKCLLFELDRNRIGSAKVTVAVRYLADSALFSKSHQLIDLIVQIAERFRNQAGSQRLLTPVDFLAGILLSNEVSSGSDVGTVRQALLSSEIRIEHLLSDSPSSTALYEPLGYGEDLTEITRSESESCLIGMEGRLEAIAIRLKFNSACLIGEPGVGKSAVVRGLAWHISHGSSFIVGSMRDWRIVSISRSDLLAGASDRGELEKRLNGLIAHLRENPNVRIFLDEVHSLLNPEDKNSSLIINALKPAMADRHNPVYLIAATTDREYERHIMMDEALHSRFSPTILIPEPSPESVATILSNLAVSLTPKEGRQRGIFLPEELFSFIVRLSVIYQRLDCLPRKAIRLLREVLEQKTYRTERYLGESPQIDRAFVLKTAQESWGVNVSREDPKFWSSLHYEFQKTSPLQPEFAQSVAGLFLRASRNQRAPRPAGAPLAKILVMCPEGAAEIALSRLLAVLRRNLFSDERAGEREDLREFASEISRSRFVGAPPAYTGFGETRTVLGKIRSRPQGGVLLLANCHYAHTSLEPDLLALFDGGARDSAGRPVDSSQWVIILTLPFSSSLPDSGQDLSRSFTPASISPRILDQMDLVLRMNPEEHDTASESFAALVSAWNERGISMPTDISAFAPQFEQRAAESGLPATRILDDYLQNLAEAELREDKTEHINP